MNLDLVFEIIDLALSLLKGKDANIAAVLVKIIQKGAQAYKAHTGQPLDQSLIHAEEPV
jgi:hypothetical protein